MVAASDCREAKQRISQSLQAEQHQAYERWNVPVLNKVVVKNQIVGHSRQSEAGREFFLRDVLRSEPHEVCERWA